MAEPTLCLVALQRTVNDENKFRGIRADLKTSEGNGIRELLTADARTVAEPKSERLSEIARRGARRGIIQRVPTASRAATRTGEE